MICNNKYKQIDYYHNEQIYKIKIKIYKMILIDIRKCGNNKYIVDRKYNNNINNY